jgi:hypothetical protein
VWSSVLDLHPDWRTRYEGVERSSIIEIDKGKHFDLFVFRTLAEMKQFRATLPPSPGLIREKQG